MEEIWKPVTGYEGLYEVSNLGRVKSLRNNIIMKDFLSNKGYKLIKLSKEKARKAYSIHRLLAQAFISNKENKKYINHLNGIRNDNNINNLEWVTGRENNLHTSRIMKRNTGETHGSAKLKKKDILEIRIMLRNNIPHSIITEEYGIVSSTISYINQRKTWRHV